MWEVSSHVWFVEINFRRSLFGRLLFLFQELEKDNTKITDLDVFVFFQHLISNHCLSVKELLLAIR